LLIQDKLARILNNATSLLQVMLIGHVPPGQFEKHINTTWYRPEFNLVFIELLRQHAAVIASAHFAHHHTDSFRLVNDHQGRFKCFYGLAETAKSLAL